LGPAPGRGGAWCCKPKPLALPCCQPPAKPPIQNRTETPRCPRRSPEPPTRPVCAGSERVRPPRRHGRRARAVRGVGQVLRLPQPGRLLRALQERNRRARRRRPQGQARWPPRGQGPEGAWRQRRRERHGRGRCQGRVQAVPHCHRRVRLPLHRQGRESGVAMATGQAGSASSMALGSRPSLLRPPHNAAPLARHSLQMRPPAPIRT
jgi:hypothetical protein